ncbi:MAG: hypothetical protein IT361_03630 [Gemmatimonadaceae bacterium]|nr:hypothetical protein [Gemmatimonadaceae bacterium]
MSIRRPDPRERRTLVIGATVAALALLGAFVVQPAARRWSDREAAIDAARDRVARLAGLRAQAPELIAASEATPGDDRVLAVRGRTVALASAELQGALQEFARVSHVSVERLDLVDIADSSLVRATMSATTDIYGVADLLTRLQASRRVLAIEDVLVTSNPVLRGQLLQLALTVRAPVVLEP